MRLDTGPVCIVDQTAPKTTPRPTPRDASRMRDVRTQLAPARAGQVRGGGARGAAMACDLLQRLGVVFGMCACVCGASPPRRRPQQQAGHGSSRELRRRRPRFRRRSVMRRSKAEVSTARADRPAIVAQQPSLAFWPLATRLESQAASSANQFFLDYASFRAFDRLESVASGVCSRSRDPGTRSKTSGCAE